MLTLHSFSSLFSGHQNKTKQICRALLKYFLCAQWYSQRANLQVCGYPSIFCSPQNLTLCKSLHFASFLTVVFTPVSTHVTLSPLRFGASWLLCSLIYWFKKKVINFNLVRLLLFCCYCKGRRVTLFPILYIR